MDAFYGYACLLLVCLSTATFNTAHAHLRAKIPDNGAWRIHTSPGLDELRLVDAAGRAQYNFTRLTSLYHPNAVVFHAGKKVRPVSSAVHYAMKEERGVVSLYRDGSADGVVFHEGRLHSVKREEVEGEAVLMRTLMDNTGHGGCGTSTDDLPVGGSVPGGRRLEVEEWKNCYSGQGTPRYLDIGIATDLQFLEANGGRLKSVLALVESAVAKTNEVFVAQFNILLRIAQVVVTSESNEAPPLSQCETSIQLSLKRFSDWAGKLPIDGDQSEQPVQQGLWHLFTACYHPPGNIGMAYIQDGNGRLGTLCYHEPESLNVGVTSLTDQLWLTFAHEVGHNFGARHSFEHGTGKTGGIMDYNVNGLFNGEVQFNPLRKGEICTEISSALASPLCTYERIDVSVAASGQTDGSERHKLSGSFFTPFHGQCLNRESTSSCEIDTGEAGACKNGLCRSLVSELVFDGQIVPHQRVCTSAEATTVQKKTLTQAHPKFGCESLRNWIEEGSGESMYVLVSAGGSCTVLEKILYAKSAGFKGAVIVQEEGVGLNGAASSCDASINGFVSLAVPWSVGVDLEEKLSRGYEVNVMYGPLAGAEASGFILHDPEIHQFVPKSTVAPDDSESTFLLILVSVLSCLAVFAGIHVLILYGGPIFERGPSKPVLPLAVSSGSGTRKEKAAKASSKEDVKTAVRKEKKQRSEPVAAKREKRRSKAGSASKSNASGRPKIKKETSLTSSEKKVSKAKDRSRTPNETPHRGNSNAVRPTGQPEKKKKSSKERQSPKQPRSRSKSKSKSKSKSSSKDTASKKEDHSKSKAKVADERVKQSRSVKNDTEVKKDSKAKTKS